jgi:hypothetical protein
MLKTLKILFIVLGLGIFILPKQMVFAQSPVEHCDKKMNDAKNCCDTKKSSDCHSHTKKDSPKQKDCNHDCNDCKSCTVQFTVNFLSAEFNSPVEKHFVESKANFDYQTLHFTSTLQNIWQPPKIG